MSSDRWFGMERGGEGSEQWWNTALHGGAEGTMFHLAIELTLHLWDLHLY